MRAHTHTNTQTHKHTHTHTYTCIHALPLSHRQKCTHIHRYILDKRTLNNVHIHTSTLSRVNQPPTFFQLTNITFPEHTRIDAYALTHACVNTSLHACVYILTCMHMHKSCTLANIHTHACMHSHMCIYVFITLPGTRKPRVYDMTFTYVARPMHIRGTPHSLIWLHAFTGLLGVTVPEQYGGSAFDATAVTPPSRPSLPYNILGTLLAAVPARIHRTRTSPPQQT